MGRTILRIDSSIFGKDGASSQLIDYWIDKQKQQDPTSKIIARNFSEQAIPHLDVAWLTALQTKPAERDRHQQEMVAFSDRLIAEVQQADQIIMGLPMYNFNLPSMLKAWFDHIARAGTTFKYTEQGPQGLLQNKPVYLIATRGGLHKGQSSDTQIDYVKTFLAFLGLTQVEVIYAEGLNMQQFREQGLQQAKHALAALV